VGGVHHNYAEDFRCFTEDLPILISHRRTVILGVPLFVKQPEILYTWLEFSENCCRLGCVLSNMCMVASVRSVFSLCEEWVASAHRALLIAAG
jgi:hypothetical protein